MFKKTKNLMIDFNEPHEFVQLWDGMTHKLRDGREAYEYPSTCYILRNEKYDKGFVYKVLSKRLEEKDPQYCFVVDNREVWAKLEKSACICPHEIEGTCVSFDGIWKNDPILIKVVSESGFSDVSAWLDKWCETKEDFECDKEYKLWLVKVLYPHTNWAISVKNGADKPIPSE
jgi:hypothetical protein